jgi:hypothetical protein
MKPLVIERIGVLAPGLPGWAASQAILAGEKPYISAPLATTTLTLLPANERRRVTATIKLALQVAQETLAAASDPPLANLRTVFASSGGDSEVLDNICTALTEPERPVSPVHFHQSVHNTPAGYWSIATGCRQASQSLSAYDGSFAAGLLDAAALAWADTAPVLLIAYDLPLPFPLSARRQIVAPFAAALLLNPATDHDDRCGLIRLALTAAEAVTPLADAGLEALRQANPAARSLPLLCALAGQRWGRVALPSGDRAVAVEVAP